VTEREHEVWLVEVVAHCEGCDRGREHESRHHHIISTQTGSSLSLTFYEFHKLCMIQCDLNTYMMCVGRSCSLWSQDGSLVEKPPKRSGRRISNVIDILCA
jgi:hypothetical protein